MRSHHRWSVFIEQHELGTPPPAWLTAGSWDGILSRPTDHAMAHVFRRMDVAVVDLNDLYEDLGLPWVGSDHAAIGKMGGTHLIEKGFRHFAFCGFTGELWSRQRGAGFFNAVSRNAVTTSVYETPWRGPDTPRWDQDMEQIVDWIRSLPKPVAIMACNDVRGLHVLDACSRAGVLVPEEVAVLGVDDEDTMCELCSPPLSSVAPSGAGINPYLAIIVVLMCGGLVGSSMGSWWISLNGGRGTAVGHTQRCALARYFAERPHLIPGARFLDRLRVRGDHLVLVSPGPRRRRRAGHMILSEI